MKGNGIKKGRTVAINQLCVNKDMASAAKLFTKWFAAPVRAKEVRGTHSFNCLPDLSQEYDNTIVIHDGNHIWLLQDEETNVTDGLQVDSDSSSPTSPIQVEDSISSAGHEWNPVIATDKLDSYIS